MSSEIEHQSVDWAEDIDYHIFHDDVEIDEAVEEHDHEDLVLSPIQRNYLARRGEAEQENSEREQHRRYLARESNHLGIEQSNHLARRNDWAESTVPEMRFEAVGGGRVGAGGGGVRVNFTPQSEIRMDRSPWEHYHFHVGNMRLHEEDPPAATSSAVSARIDPNTPVWELGTWETQVRRIKEIFKDKEREHKSNPLRRALTDRGEIIYPFHNNYRLIEVEE